jgi:hypothetical protein
MLKWRQNDDSVTATAVVGAEDHLPEGGRERYVSDIL